jgi:hypothetical protein
VRAGRSFRVQRSAAGPVRTVVGPGVLAAVFAVLLCVAGAPAHIGAVGPDGAGRSVPLLAHRSHPAAVAHVAHVAHEPAVHGCGQQHRVIV